MAFFLARLIGPRSDFAFTMTEAERELMGRHAAYLADKAMIYGPVADPAGPWGLGIFEASERAELDIVLANDPTILAEAGFRYDVLPMPAAVLGRAVIQPDRDTQA